jgi:hypothetical protein
MEDIVVKIFGAIFEGIGYFLRRVYFLFFLGSYEEADREYRRKKKKILFGYVISPNQLTALLTLLGILILYNLL